MRIVGQAVVLPAPKRELGLQKQLVPPHASGGNRRAMLRFTPFALVIWAAVAILTPFALVALNGVQPLPELPFSPAAEIAGVVEAVGEGVTDLKVGQRVCGYIGWNGARERVAVPAKLMIPIPDGVTDAEAAGVSVTYGTAMHGLKDRGGLKAGESVAVGGSSTIMLDRDGRRISRAVAGGGR